MRPVTTVSIIGRVGFSSGIGFFAVIVSKPAGGNGALAVFWEVVPPSTALCDDDVVFLL